MQGLANARYLGLAEGSHDTGAKEGTQCPDLILHPLQLRV